MADDLTLEQKDWRERFRAVALAQGRYLYVLLIVALFFAALADANAWNLKDAHGDQELSLIGIKLKCAYATRGWSPRAGLGNSRCSWNVPRSGLCA